MTDLTMDLGFMTLKNPVFAASGTFGCGLEFEPYLGLGQLGGLVVKGLYCNPREGNPPPRLVETPSGLINAIGLQGIGVKAFAGPDHNPTKGVVIIKVEKGKFVYQTTINP